MAASRHLEGRRVRLINRVVKLLAVLGLALMLPLAAHAEQDVTAPGQTTSGTYMDYMKTVYDRAGERPTSVPVAYTANRRTLNLEV